jgi:predicted glycoside hydrolase/deacetylase ChbG (UPF0249 family)
MTEPRFLIVNADDLGLTDAVNAGVFAAYEFPDLGVELHLEVGEYRAQLERFRELVGREPDHLDSHKHIRETEPVSAVAEALAAELGVPLRNRQVRYEGSFFARGGDGEPQSQLIAPEYLTELIRSLPPGWTEIGCHPAAGPVPISSYDAERQIELATLTDSRVKNLLNVTGVRLCSFAQVEAE